jgi:peptide/nickel transport system ATP-binding protein
MAESGNARAVIDAPQSAIGKALVAAAPRLNRTLRQDPP